MNSHCFWNIKEKLIKICFFFQAKIDTDSDPGSMFVFAHGFFNKTSSWTGWSSLLPTTLVTQTQLRRGTNKNNLPIQERPAMPVRNQQRQKTEGIRVMWILFALNIYNSKVWKTWKDIFLVHCCSLLFPIILVPCNWTSHVGVCLNARLQWVFDLYSFLTKGNSF